MELYRFEIEPIVDRFYLLFATVYCSDGNFFRFSIRTLFNLSRKGVLDFFRISCSRLWKIPVNRIFRIISKIRTNDEKEKCAPWESAILPQYQRAHISSYSWMIVPVQWKGETGAGGWLSVAVSISGCSKSKRRVPASISSQQQIKSSTWFSSAKGVFFYHNFDDGF